MAILNFYGIVVTSVLAWRLWTTNQNDVSKITCC
jgi:hypothetical protein